MGAGISSQDVSHPLDQGFMPALPSEVLEHLFSFLSVQELLMAASVCSSWRSEAFRAITNQTGTVLLNEGTMSVGGQLINASTCKDLILSLESLQKTYVNVEVVICGFWLKSLCSQNNLFSKWLERRRLAVALCRLERVEISDLTTGMARALFFALARCRTVELKSLVLPNGWTGSLRLASSGLLRVQNLNIGALGCFNTANLLLTVCKNVGQLKSLTLGYNVRWCSISMEMETVTRALNQVKKLSLDLRGHTSFRDYLLLKATLTRLATPGESNLKHLRLKNLDNSLTRNMEPDLWVAAVSALDFFSLQVNTFNLNNEGLVEDSFGIEVRDIIEILITVPGERVDKMVRTESGKERHFHIHPFGICPEKCLDLNV